MLRICRSSATSLMVRKAVGACAAWRDLGIDGQVFASFVALVHRLIVDVRLQHLGRAKGQHLARQDRHFDAGLGLRPTRWPFWRTRKVPKAEIFTASRLPTRPRSVRAQFRAARHSRSVTDPHWRRSLPRVVPALPCSCLKPPATRSNSSETGIGPASTTKRGNARSEARQRGAPGQPPPIASITTRSPAVMRPSP